MTGTEHEQLRFVPNKEQEWTRAVWGVEDYASYCARKVSSSVGDPSAHLAGCFRISMLS